MRFRLFSGFLKRRSVNTTYFLGETDNFNMIFTMHFLTNTFRGIFSDIFVDYIFHNLFIQWVYCDCIIFKL